MLLVAKSFSARAGGLSRASHHSPGTVLTVLDTLFVADLLTPLPFELLPPPPPPWPLGLKLAIIEGWLLVVVPLLLSGAVISARYRGLSEENDKQAIRPAKFPGE